MTSIDKRSEIVSIFKMMTAEERVEAILEVYRMNFIDRQIARILLGIDESTYHDRVVSGRLIPALEYRFDYLPDEFLSVKYKEQMKDCGE